LQKDINNPFQGLPALEKAIGRKVVARIGSNESIGMPRHPLAEVLPGDLVDLCRLYPDPYSRDLRTKLAKLAPGAVEDAAHVLLDSGGDSLIFLTLRTRIVPGDCVITSRGTYPTFNYFCQGLGAEIVEVPYSDDGATCLRPDLAGLAAAAHSKKAALVYLANPDNPTGYVFRPEEVAKLREQLPPDTTLIVDEAYIDFSPENALCERLDNTVQIRTLSKAYGLAGLRVGYAIAAPEWIQKADQIRIQFASGSLTAFLVDTVLSHPTFSKELMSSTLEWRTRLEQELVSCDATVLPSATNFVGIRYKSAEDALSRQQELLKEGIAVHRPPHAAMQSLLRVTVGPQALDPVVIKVLTR